jgi:Multimeric flavodoxin WrbA
MNNEVKMENALNLIGLRILCISASNRSGVKETNSYKLCKAVLDEAKKHISGMESEIIELKNHTLSPCIACSKCSCSIRRCAIDNVFNQIYEKIIACDVLFIISPHYAPIPAKLCMLLEKMGTISFIPWAKDNSYQSETYGIKTAVISHGIMSVNEDAQKRCKRVVNDPIANALHTPQLKLIPFNDEWDTGIVVRPINKNAAVEQLFDEKINEYVRKVLNIEENVYRQCTET